ncbi:hypothetical protein P4H42_08175 [Paenibacillus macerans]|uniref:hypothetical protein n=1 Tax=Paenibacillus macerans TaxID=44252 RepID=UPI002DBA1318|nr:hypothetical protein [Paenibacillus macerans]MEC0329598.1 hypothetical protein [Paenibacillus macerans]
MSYSYEIFKLFKEVSLERGLDKAFVDTILKDVDVIKTKPFNTVKFRLKVDGLKFPLEFHSDRESKLFELRGINTRYKTTSLIVIGILLGCDWGNQTSFLSNYKLESQIEEVKAYFFNKEVNIEMYIESESEIISLTKKENYIQVMLNEKIEYERLLHNFEIDMQEYQQFMSRFFKVQFISKGRDFVTQVHHEILENIKESFDYLINNCREILSKFMSDKSRKIYSKSQKEFENELVLLVSLKKLISDFKTENHDVVDLSIYEHLDSLKDNESKFDQLNEKKNAIIAKTKQYRIEKQTLIEEGVNDSANIVKAPSNWKDPVRNVNEILRSVERLDGTDLVPMYVELQDSFIKINNSDDFKKLIQLLNDVQMNATSYHNLREKYQRLFELNRLIDEEESALSKTINDLKRLEEIILQTKELSVSSSIDLKVLLPKIKSIQMLMQKCGIGELGVVSEIITLTEKKIEETSRIIEEIKTANSKDDYIPYEILNSILFEFNSVKSLLVDKSGNQTNFNSSIKETAEESFLYTQVVELFNDLMKERCKYYYKVTDDNVESIELKSYDFESRMLTTLDGDEISARYGLSGGIDSAMTVRSLASSQNDSLYGTVLLVDEWGDVSDKLAGEVYNTLYEINQLSFGLFVEVSEDEQAKIQCIDRL